MRGRNLKIQRHDFLSPIHYWKRCDTCRSTNANFVSPKGKRYLSVSVLVWNDYYFLKHCHYNLICFFCLPITLQIIRHEKIVLDLIPSTKVFHILFLKFGPLYKRIHIGMPNWLMIVCSMNFTILGPLVDTIDANSTHFVKYSMVVIEGNKNTLNF